jgi:hypothetical protein
MEQQVFARRLKALFCTVIVACLLSSCANLRGIPQGLNDANRSELSKGDIKSTIGVARDLQGRYEVARDNNLDYAFWSNVAFIPLAAVAAGAIAFNAYKDLYAGVGIAAGSLAGANVFVNARANAKVYQLGINGLDCVVVNLGQYANASPSDLSAGDIELERRLAIGRADLIRAQGFKFTTPPEVAEIQNNPLVITTLVTNEKILAQAVDDAETTSSDARTELGLFAQLPSYAADSVTQVNKIVASKISQTDVPFSSLVTSLGALAKVPAAPKPAATTSAAAPSQTPLGDAATQALASAQALFVQTVVVRSLVQQFGLSNKEKRVDECIKSLQ